VRFTQALTIIKTIAVGEANGTSVHIMMTEKVLEESGEKMAETG
jgi:hypothetical protein